MGNPSTPITTRGRFIYNQAMGVYGGNMYTFNRIVFVRPNYDKAGSEDWSPNWKGYMKFYGSGPDKVLGGFEVSIMERPDGLWAQAHGQFRYQIRHYPSIMKAINGFVDRYEGRIRELFNQPNIVTSYPFRKPVTMRRIS